jgi:hypothetical protein
VFSQIVSIANEHAARVVLREVSTLGKKKSQIYREGTSKPTVPKTDGQAIDPL